MNDIVSDLMSVSWHESDDKLHKRAAGEIKRLREGLKTLADNPWTNSDHNAEFAQSVLDGPETPEP